MALALRLLPVSAAGLLLAGCCGLGSLDLDLPDDFEDRVAVIQGPDPEPAPERVASPRDLPVTPSSPVGPVPDRIAPLCGAQDEIAFNCSLPGDGNISICAVSGERSNLQIRAGTPDHVQLAMPASEASRVTRLVRETNEDSTERITVMEPPFMAVLTIVNAEGPSGLMEPAKMELVVHDDGVERLRLACDPSYGLMSGGQLDALPGE